MKKENRKTKGFTLLFSILVISIVLSIASILSVFVIREVIISGVGRESQKAFFASDSGMECALYWDIKQNAFATSSTREISCSGSSATVGGISGVSSFTLNFSNGSCAKITVDKSIFPNTIFKSYGYNTCSLVDPNRVERALQISY